MKAWVTKYALTSGIRMVEAEICSDVSPDMIKWNSGGYDQYAHGEGRDWHRTRDDAVVRAHAMRLKKIASLEKQIKRLRSMTFEADRAPGTGGTG